MSLESGRGAFGSILRRLRTEAGLSQEELAERARMSVENVSALERGRRKAPYAETIRLLSDALHLTPDQHHELRTAAKRTPPSAPTVIRYDSDDAGDLAERHIADPKHNLVRPLSTFFNRDREIAELSLLLNDHRLCTIVGAGGIGKTRIAIELSWKVLGRFDDGVWFVDLAPLNDQSSITRTFADELEIPLTGTEDIKTLRHHLRRRKALIVIDNCEHVLRQVAELIDGLLPFCPDLQVVATSRERLNAAGERVYRIPSLDAPAETEVVNADQSVAFASIALFIDRARAANDRVPYDHASAPIVANICRRLDGIPLAIELAASRTATLTPQQILAQLNIHFGLLSGGRRTALARQQTMRETIKWSFDRLDSVEQRLFCRLAIFPKGFVASAVEFVMGDELRHGVAPFDLLASLVDKSLLVAETRGAATRFRILEPTRAFGIEMLAETAELADARSLLADWCLNFVRSAHDTWASAPSSDWFADVAPELDNLRGCLDWALADAQAIETGQRIVVHSRRIWARLAPSEGAAWIAAAKRHLGSASSSSLRAGLAVAEAHLCLALHRYRDVLQAFEVFDQLAGDEHELTIAEIRCFAGVALSGLGRIEEGERLILQSVAVYRQHAAEQLAATGLTELACVHVLRGQLLEARRLFREALAIFRRLGNTRGIASVSGNLAEAENIVGNTASAIKLCAEALSMSSSDSEARMLSNNLAAYHIKKGDYTAARTYGLDSLSRRGLASAEIDVAFSLQHLAAVAALRPAHSEAGGEARELAAKLLGFVDTCLTRLSFSRPPTDLEEYTRVRAKLTEVLGEVRLAQLMDEGGALTEEEAIQEASRL